MEWCSVQDQIWGMQDTTFPDSPSRFSNTSLLSCFLCMDGGEPELSEEAAVQELQLLHVIFPHAHIDYSARKGAVSVPVSARVEVVVKEACSGRPEATLRTPVHHLPPVEVCFSLPEGYPETKGPEVSVVSAVLPVTSLNALHTEIASFWDVYGDQVLFTIVEHVQNQANNHVEALLGGDSVDCGTDVELYHTILQHDRVQKKTQFCNDTFVCQICQEDHKGAVCTQFEACRHVFCNHCLRGFFELLIEEGAVERVHCPDFECTKAQVAVREKYVRLEGIDIEKFDFEEFKQKLLTLPIRVELLGEILGEQDTSDTERDGRNERDADMGVNGVKTSGLRAQANGSSGTPSLNNISRRDTLRPPNGPSESAPERTLPDPHFRAENIQNGPPPQTPPVSLVSRFVDLYLKQQYNLITKLFPARLVPCPRQGCSEMIFRENTADPLVICRKCHYAFCSSCSKLWHGTFVVCDKKDRMYLAIPVEALEQWLEAEPGSPDRTRLGYLYGKMLMRKTADEYLMDKKFNEMLSDECLGLHKCPTCEIIIQRSDGCNKMCCTSCKTFFCNLCGCYLDYSRPYFHYQDPESECYGRLFEGMPGVDD